jgi:Family of unknown function (DUF6932)
MIPKFRRDGLLPPGQHAATWGEVTAALAFSAKRQLLMDGLRRMCCHLRAAGATVVWIDGSFATAKPDPSDFDLCYRMTEVDDALLMPCVLDFSNERAAMKAEFLGEAWPDIWPSGTNLTIFDFFQKDKATGRPKGIIELDLGALQC